MNDHYATLEVSPLASDEEIKKAYRRLVFKYHPDRNQGNSRAQEKMQEINTAYEILGDPKTRKLYDQFRFDSQRQSTEQQPQPPPPPPEKEGIIVWILEILKKLAAQKRAKEGKWSTVVWIGYGAGMGIMALIVLLAPDPPPTHFSPSPITVFFIVIAFSLIFLVPLYVLYSLLYFLMGIVYHIAYKVKK